jgi:secondary thiamine-phosphate synthase enzyme
MGTIAMIYSDRIDLTTEGNADIHNITGQVRAAVSESGCTAGIVTIFTPSATSALTTIEDESGCRNDFQRLFDEIAAPDRYYAHNERYGDGNGHSHVRAALLGPSLTIPFVDGELTLGTWQEIIFVDFENRPRQRRLILQIRGEM